MDTDLKPRFRDHIVEHGLFESPGLALLAVSGGPDSVALLDLMWLVREELGLTLAVAHVAHGISSEATAFAPQVQKLANLYKVPFFLEKLTLGPEASETLAREARYEALRSIQREVKAGYLVTAHHLDDQIETVLYRFLRGTGVAGLAGIPSKGPDGLVRPLLAFGREELAQWLVQRYPDTDERPPLFEDPANMDPKHDRSWLRHHLLPTLRQRFGPELDGHIVGVGVHADRDNAAWAALLRILPDLEFDCELGICEVARAPLSRYDKLLSEAVLRAVTREAGCRIGSRQVASLLEFAASGTSGRSMQLGSGWEATIVFEKLRIHRPSYTDALGEMALAFAEGGEGSVRWGAWEFVWRTETAESCTRNAKTTWLTYGCYIVRTPSSGDRIQPFGGVGSRELRRVLMEARVPAADRSSFPVLSRGRDVVWVPGICRSRVAVPEIGEVAVRLEAHGS